MRASRWKYNPQPAPADFEVGPWAHAAQSNRSISAIQFADTVLDCVVPGARPAPSNWYPLSWWPQGFIPKMGPAISVASSTVISTIVVPIVLARIAVAIARIIITATIIILWGSESGSR